MCGMGGSAEGRPFFDGAVAAADSRAEAEAEAALGCPSTAPSCAVMCALHESHTRTGSSAVPTLCLLREQWSQKMRPHALQWCLRRKREKREPHWWQLSTESSSSQEEGLGAGARDGRGREARGGVEEVEWEAGEGAGEEEGVRRREREGGG